MKSLSPTQRTLRALREQGRLCAIVEKWNRFGGPVVPAEKGGDGKRRLGNRVDLFGFVDVLALDPERGFVGIQSTGQAFSEHERRIVDSDVTENVIAWLKAGGSVELWGWRKVQLTRGSKALRWQPRVRVFSLEDFVR